MKGTTPKKGRPTPTAPQNRPRTTPATTEADVRPTDQLARSRYRTYRKATRFWRRAFGGQAVIDQRVAMMHQNDAQAFLRFDGKRVAEYVRFHLGGVEDVVKISQGLGMKRGRVRLILNLGLAR